MDNFLIFILTVLGEDWLIQNLIASMIFALLSYPFSKISIKKKLKKSRINDAKEELYVEYTKHIIENKSIEKDDFFMMLYIISNRHNLEIQDIYNESEFNSQIINQIANSKLIADYTKNNLIKKILTNKIYSEVIEQNSDMEENDLSSKNNINTSDRINITEDEERKINKLTLIIMLLIFLFLFLYISFIHLLFNICGMSGIILVNIIFITIIIIPILAKGIFYYDELYDNDKKIFSVSLLILLLNLINFICIINALLKDI